MQETTIEVTSAAFSARLANLLVSRRDELGVSRRQLARRSGGGFTAAQLRALERGTAATEDLDSDRLAALYEVDLSVILPERTALVIDEIVGLVATAGVSRTFVPGDRDSLLTAYLRLVRELRSLQRAPEISLRRDDVETLASHLRIDGAAVLDRLGQLMGSSVAQRRSAVAMFGAGAALIVLTSGAAALAPGTGSGADGAGVGAERDVLIVSTPTDHGAATDATAAAGSGPSTSGPDGVTTVATDSGAGRFHSGTQNGSPPEMPDENVGGQLRTGTIAQPDPADVSIPTGPPAEATVQQPANPNAGLSNNAGNGNTEPGPQDPTDGNGDIGDTEDTDGTEAHTPNPNAEPGPQDPTDRSGDTGDTEDTEDTEAHTPNPNAGPGDNAGNGNTEPDPQDPTDDTGDTEGTDGTEAHTPNPNPGPGNNAGNGNTEPGPQDPTDDTGDTGDTGDTEDTEAHTPNPNAGPGDNAGNGNTEPGPQDPTDDTGDTEGTEGTDGTEAHTPNPNAGPGNNAGNGNTEPGPQDPTDDTGDTGDTEDTDDTEAHTPNPNPGPGNNAGNGNGGNNAGGIGWGVGGTPSTHTPGPFG